MKIKVIVLLSIIILLVGCNASMKIISSSPGYLTTIEEIDVLDDKISSKVNSFTLKMYNKLYQDKQNMFFSPVSIYLALGMTYNGADGNTALEMASVLGIDDLSLAEFNELNRDLQSLILGYDKTTFQLANSIWIRDSYKDYVKDDFIKRNKDYYGAMVSSLDFNDPESKNVINNWVKENTKGKIEKAIDADKINPSTMMYLINTIYFKANWQKTFNKENTKDGLFNSPNGPITVDMMNKIDKIGYIENDNLQGVLLPYEDNKTAMFIFLPKDSLNDLDITDINTYITNMKNNKVNVALNMPKVKIEYASNLNETLKRMGMIDAFDSNANFSKLTTNNDLYISNVIHKSFLAIDEKGTEAAAMTSVEIGKTSAQEIDYTMNVNHPFLTGIVDLNSNTILFMGAVFNP